MAQNAVDRFSAYCMDVLALLEPGPGRLQFAVRLALICALTVLVAEIYQTPDIALTVYLAFFLNQNDRTKSLILDVVFLLLFAVVIAFVFLVAMFVLDDPMWRVISIAVISFGLLFLASASKLKPLGAPLALISGYALDKLGSVQLGEEATRALLYVWLFVGIPSGVSIVVNLLMARPPFRLAQDAIAWRLLLAAAMLRNPDENSRRRFRDVLGEGIAPIEGWLHLAGVERTTPPADIAALHQAARSSVVLLSAIDVMDRQLDARLPQAVGFYIADCLEEMASILTAGSYPVNIVWEAPETTLPVMSARVLADIWDAIVHFAAAPTIAAPAAGQKSKQGFFAEDAFSNPGYVHYALKTTAAAMLCFFLYNILDWPSIHTCFITCYIVSLGTAAESIEKLSLRIGGCLLGAAAGTAAIVYLIPNLVSIGALMLVVFAGGVASAYVAGGSPRISYAGFQIAFAFFLCVIQGNGPAFDLTIARDRVVGILLGNLVSFFVFTAIWPVSVAQRLDPAIACLLRRLASLATDPVRVERQKQAAEAQAALGAIQTDLRLAGYEPTSLLPSPAWFAIRRQAVEALAEVQGPLFLAANQQAPLPDDVPIRLRAGAAMLEQPANRECAPGSLPHATDPLLTIIDRSLGRLESAITPRAELGKEEASYAAA